MRTSIGNEHPGPTTTSVDIYGSTYTGYGELPFYLINESASACTLTGWVAGPTPVVIVTHGESAMFTAIFVMGDGVNGPGPYQVQMTVPGDPAPLAVLIPNMYGGTNVATTPLAP